MAHPYFYNKAILKQFQSHSLCIHNTAALVSIITKYMQTIPVKLFKLDVNSIQVSN